MKTIKKNHGGRGGLRRGAGRKPGTANRRTREIANKAAAEGITPLEYMLDLMRKPYPKGATAAVKAVYDEMRLDAAKAAAPYMHPRLASRDNAVSLDNLSSSLADSGRTVLGALSDGKVTPGEAAIVMQSLATQAKLVETSELERRVVALEERNLL